MSDKIKLDPQGPYSYLLVNKPLRKILIFTIIACSAALASFLILEFRQDGGHFGMLALYTCIICSPVLFFPMTETWVYRPWQKAPQRLERHDGN